MSFFGGPSPSHHNHRPSKPTSSRPSYSRAPSSTTSFFSRAGNSSTSYYKRRPRDNYIQSLLRKLKRLIRDLWDYARRHPFKAFMAVVVPLISAGGALHGLLRQFGVRLPAVFEDIGGARGGGYYGSVGYGREDDFGGFGNLLKVARAFM